MASFSTLELGPTDVPLITALTTDAAGNYELLDDLSILRIGGDVWVSGTTTHFSPLAFTNEQMPITVPVIPPPEFTIGDTDLAAGSGDTDGVAVQLTGPAGFPDAAALPLANGYGDIPVSVHAAGTDPGARSGGIDIIGTSSGTFTFDDVDLTVEQTSDTLDIDGLASTQSLLTFGGNDAPGSVDLTAGVAIFQTVAEPDPLEVIPEPAEAIGGQLSVLVTHQPLGDKPSFTTGFIGGLSDDPFDGDLDGYLLIGDGSVDTSYVPSSRVVDVAPLQRTGDEYTADLGIECFCGYALFALMLPPGSPRRAGPPSAISRSQTVRSSTSAILAASRCCSR